MSYSILRGCATGWLGLALRYMSGALVAFTIAAGSIPIAAAEKRVALVIGNSRYIHTPELKNPKNDAADLAAVLRTLNFTVVEGLDLSKAQMDTTIRDFAEQLGGADVAVFFYAGHGLQVNGQNYLVPTDAKLATAAALDFEMVRLDLIQRTMERETNTNVIILDACRNNPLARNLARAMGTRSIDIGRGLAPTESGVGTLISFSTQPGNVALDGDGRNSPFAASLVKHIQKPDEDISSILISVRNDVIAATKNRQVPWEHSALRARLFFLSSASQSGASETAEPNRTATSVPAFDGTWQVSLRGNEHCSIRSATFVLFVKDSVVLSRQKVGTVGLDGTIEFNLPGTVRPDLTVRHRGKLSQIGGVGVYKVDKVPCAGTSSFKRSAQP
jgi:hypothetical protein